MDLLHTLLELGHATSEKLDFAYSLSPELSFGEETITETNLLEISRRHPKTTRIETFSKHAESRATGADWEWHIIGRSWTLQLRVQAKRITKHGGIKGIYQKGKNASKTQIDLLIDSATRTNLLPIYCFYCAEQHRNIWTKSKMSGSHSSLKIGCLISPATTVKKLDPKSLREIEAFCRPWHYLWAEKYYTLKKNSYEMRFREDVPTDRYMEEIEILSPPTKASTSRDWGIPKVSDLNNDKAGFLGRQGVIPSDAYKQLENLSHRPDRDQRASLVLKVDVSEPGILTMMSR